MRKLFLFAAVLCFFGLYSLEAAHHHVDDADEMACAVCHVAAHSAADIPVPDLSTPLFTLVLLFLVSFTEISPLFRRASVRPRSRSPPSF